MPATTAGPTVHLSAAGVSVLLEATQGRLPRDGPLGSGAARPRRGVGRRARHRVGADGRAQQRRRADAGRARPRALDRLVRPPRAARLTRRPLVVGEAAGHRRRGRRHAGHRLVRRRRRHPRRRGHRHRRGDRPRARPRAAAQRRAAPARDADQHRRAGPDRRRPHRHLPHPHRGDRAARLRRPLGPGAPRRSAPTFARACTCARTAAAAPATTRATLLHAGTPGLRLRARGEVLGRAHRVERQPRPLRRARAPPASRRSAAASCCCPARSASPPASPTPARGSTAPSATASTASPAASTAVQRAAPAAPPPRPRRSRSTCGRRSTSTTTWPGCVDLAERAAALGVERFVLDDGWFGVAPRRPLRPGRLGRARGRVARRAAPARRPRARARHGVRAVVRAGDGQPRLRRRPRPPGVGHGRPARLAGRVAAPAGARPRASRRRTPTCSDQMRALLDEYDIDYVKWDHNRDLVEAGNRSTAAAPRSTRRPSRSTGCSTSCGRRHPGLEIESCSSGGARVDLGVLERTDRVWV